MKLTTFLSATSLTYPALCLAQDTEPTPTSHVKRQNNDFSQLLQLASLAGIPVPTDNPALLLSIAPLAASLNSLLPTAPVLSALESAAPTGLLSSLVHDPPFAASWIASFEKGPSPSWFLALPTSVLSYMHTYADGGNLVAVATAAQGIQSVESRVSSEASASARASSLSGNTTMSSSTLSGNGTTAGTTLMGMTTTPLSSNSGSTAGSTSTSSLSTNLATAGAARETGMFAAGAVAMAGILGLAVAL